MVDGRNNPDSRSLVVRLVRGALLWAVPLLAFIAFTLTWLYRASTYRLFDEPLESTVTSLIAAAEIRETGKLSLIREPIDPVYQRGLSGKYWMIGEFIDGGEIRPVMRSRSLSEASIDLPNRDDISLRVLVGEQIRTNAAGPDTSEVLRVVARSVILPKRNNEPLVMMAAANPADANRAVRRFGYIALGLMTLLTLGLVTAVYMQVRLGLQPLFALRDSVADVREGRAAHVDGDYPTEIQPLATELNVLIDHNKDVVERARTHVGNLAHALKTPLAVLLNEAKTTDSALSDIVIRQSNTMRKQVDHHLERARAAARGQTIGASADVAETLEALVRTLERIYQDKHIDFEIDITADLVFRGEKRDLEEMAGNLMDNACKWAKGAISVKAAIDGDGRRFVINVEDDGPGLLESQYAEAIKRGSRLDEETPGTGFGLAIVDDLARAYKGRLELGKASLGGLRARLYLPGRI